MPTLVGGRDRARTFEPQIVKKRQRRLGKVDEIRLSLYAKVDHRGDLGAFRGDLWVVGVQRNGQSDH
jgi:putative transposase